MGYWKMTAGALTGWQGLGSVPTGWSILAGGDLDHNGLADILWQYPQVRLYGYWKMLTASTYSWAGLGTV